MVAKHLRGQLPRRNDGLTVRNLSQHCVEIRRLHDLQILVGGIVLRATDTGSRIIEGYAFLLQERDDPLQIETLLLLHDEMVLVAEEADAEDPPHVVDPVRVIERHAPALGGWREGA